MITKKRNLTGMAVLAIAAMTVGSLTVGPANADDGANTQVKANSLAEHVEKVKPNHGKRLSLQGMQAKSNKTHVMSASRKPPMEW